MPNPQYPAAADQVQRAQWILEYAENAFKNPNFVGWHLCGVIDAWNVEGKQKPGIMDPLGEKHTEVIDALATIGNNLYGYRGIEVAANTKVRVKLKRHDFKKDGYSAIGRPALYREMLDEQLALGAPIDGIGFQSHKSRFNYPG
jgi:hypothetical protein